jgi:hypothetical protein
MAAGRPGVRALPHRCRPRIRSHSLLEPETGDALPLPERRNPVQQTARCERFIPIDWENMLKPIVPAGVEARANSRSSPKIDPAKADDLVHRAHRVLVHYLPGAQLPSELAKVRAMLDAHMFGRDKRQQRDDVVEIAREIDSLRASQVR